MSSVRRREAARRRCCALLRPEWARLKQDVLTPPEARVLSLRLGLVSNVGLTQAQIARRLGRSTNTIAEIEKRARRKVVTALHLEEF